MKRIGFVREPEFQPEQMVLAVHWEHGESVQYRITVGKREFSFYVPKVKLPAEAYPERVTITLEPSPGTKWRKYGS